MPLIEKKKIIAILSQIGTVKTYRLLERYVEQAEGELKHWNRAGLRHCQMLLESSLSDKSVGGISTGLGGKGNMLRYIVVVGLLKPDLHSEQKRIIEESFQHTCSHHAQKRKTSISRVLMSRCHFWYRWIYLLEVLLKKVFKSSMGEHLACMIVIS